MEVEEPLYVKGERFEGFARVLKRYRYSDYLTWFDIITTSSKSSTNVALYSVIVKSLSREIASPEWGVKNAFDIHAGDVVKIIGFHEEIVKDKDAKRITKLKEGVEQKELWSINSLLVMEADGSSVSKVLEWDIKAHLSFFFNEQKYITPQRSNICDILCENELPHIALQVHAKSIEKTIALLRHRYPSVEFRESTTLMPKSKDRLICCFDRNPLEKKQLSLAALAADDILSQAVKRVYALNYNTYNYSNSCPVSCSGSPCPSCVFIVHPHLDEAIELFLTTLVRETDNGRLGVRIQANPSYAAAYIIQKTMRTEQRDNKPTSSSFSSSSSSTIGNNIESTNIINWDPKQFVKILSMVYVDGVWVLSLVDSSLQPIHNIYETSNRFGIHNKNNSSTSEVGCAGDSKGASAVLLESVAQVGEQRGGGIPAVIKDGFAGTGSGICDVATTEILPHRELESLLSASSSSSSDRVCKSVNKLHEILTRNGWIYDHVGDAAVSDSSATADIGTCTSSLSSSSPSITMGRVLHRYGLCIDVGASPGGWTTYLAKSCSCQRIIAVDKGNVMLAELKGGGLPHNVQHWRMLGQQAVLQLAQLCDSAVSSRAALSSAITCNGVDEKEEEKKESTTTNDSFLDRIDLYCCDANIEPSISTDLLVSCVTQYNILNHGARFVLTLKNCLPNKQLWEAAKVSSFDLLSRHFSQVRLVSLLSNTPRECTITGVFV